MDVWVSNKTWPRMILLFDMAKTCFIICLTANLRLPECVNHNTPFFVSRENWFSYFSSHSQSRKLLNEKIWSSSVIHFLIFFFSSCLFFFSFIIFLCWTGAKRSLILGLVALTSFSILNTPAWFWPEIKMSIANNGTDWHYVPLV